MPECGFPQTANPHETRTSSESCAEACVRECKHTTTCCGQTARSKAACKGAASKKVLKKKKTQRRFIQWTEMPGKRSHRLPGAFCVYQRERLKKISPGSKLASREPIAESQHGRGWQGPLWVTQSNPLPKQGHPEQAAQNRGQAGLEYLQRRRLHSHPGQPGPGLRHPQREEVLPHLQLELPLLQFVPVARSPPQAASLSLAAPFPPVPRSRRLTPASPRGPGAS